MLQKHATYFKRTQISVQTIGDKPYYLFQSRGPLFSLHKSTCSIALSILALVPYMVIGLPKYLQQNFIVMKMREFNSLCCYVNVIQNFMIYLDYWGNYFIETISLGNLYHLFKVVKPMIQKLRFRNREMLSYTIFQKDVLEPHYL